MKMKQYDVVEKISQAIIAGGLAKAIFIRGSLARGTEDQYSNVDLGVIVDDECLQKFIKQRYEYIKIYSEVMYIKNEYHPELATICIYENGLYLKLFAFSLSNFHNTDDIAIIYDPEGIIKNLSKESLSFSPTEVGSLLDSFFLNAIEYYNSYKRGDLIYSFRLASQLAYDLGIFLRIQYDPEYAKLGLKKFMNQVDFQSKEKYFEIIKKLKYDTSLECVKWMYVFLDSYLNTLPIAIVKHINFDFYNYTKQLIMSIV